MIKQTKLHGDIVIIDDDISNLKFLANILSREGYSVRPILTGQQALHSLQQKMPDLILLDIMMPDISGYELCQQFKSDERTRDVPVIFLSGLTALENKLKAFEVGGVDYMTKPFQGKEVLARVNTQVSLSRLHREISASRAQLRQLADASFAALIVHAPAGTILEVNQAALTLFECDRDTLIGRNLFDFIAPSLKALIQEGTDKQPRESEMRSIQNTAIPVEIRFDAISWDGDPACITALVDIRWRKTLQAENFALHLAQSKRQQFGRLVGKSLAMLKVYERLTQAAATRDAVIISGETGTGKELAARTVCELSQSATSAFVTVNCGALQESLFESLFFGYRKGAFTGADRDTPGYFEQANGGTLFLDEVEELTPLMQAKLLRVLQEREFRAVGAATLRATNARIVAATNQPLRALVRSGKMREDFFHRLHVLSIEMPPLRERKEDIPLLIAHFLKERSADAPEIDELPAALLDRFFAYDWPGNVRELANELRRYLTTGDVELGGSVSRAAGSTASLPFLLPGMTLTAAVDAFEQFYISQTLREHHDRKSETAKALGIGRRTLYTKLNLSDEH